MAFQLGTKAAVEAAGLLPKLGAALKGLPGLSTAAKAAGVFLGANVLAAGVESATGVDVPWLGEGLAHDAVAGSAQAVGNILGGAQAAATRGYGEGAITGLLPDLNSAQGKQMVTVAILAIGGVLLFKAIK